MSLTGGWQPSLSYGHSPPLSLVSASPPFQNDSPLTSYQLTIPHTGMTRTIAVLKVLKSPLCCNRFCACSCESTQNSELSQPLGQVGWLGNITSLCDQRAAVDRETQLPMTLSLACKNDVCLSAGLDAAARSVVHKPVQLGVLVHSADWQISTASGRLHGCRPDLRSSHSPMGKL